MSEYVILWLDGGEFETVPVHETKVSLLEDVYVSKAAALNAAINDLIRQREILSDVIQRARKRQRNDDRRRMRREPA